MNISYSWLKKYIDTTLSAHEVAEVLTSIGLEVGGVDEHESIRGGLRGLVIGKVVTCREHTNSDHLHVTTVDLGRAFSPEGPLQIVCGAPNVAAGQTVVVATIGTTLYAGDDSFTIKKGKIRGEESYGMICAADEIGLGTDHDGIMVLPDDVPVGTLASDYFGVSSDYMIEVDITPNRVDATSHYGVARDLYAYLSSRGDSCSLTRPEAPELTYSGTSPLTVAVTAGEAVLRYSGVVLEGVEVKESPEWLKQCLGIIGQKSINNVVDATNYILHEIGQPLHAFDLAQVRDGQLVVRMAHSGEELTTLDHSSHTLTDMDTVICDAERPLCLAGVMGGENSGVTEKTQSLFLEVATFHPSYVRKSARRHGLSSDSSFRFERGLDPNEVDYALRRAVALIQEVAGGTVVGQPYDYYPTPLPPYAVELGYAKLNALIGIEIPHDQVRRILAALDIVIADESGDTLSLQVPRYRYDVTRDVDVIEEILRIYGYNNIPLTGTLKSSLGVVSDSDTSMRRQQRISEQLVGAGFHEILNNSLSMERYYRSDEELKRAVQLLNPLSADLSTLRLTLLHGGLETIEHNLKRRLHELRLFEYGNVYYRIPESQESPLPGYEERYRLALWISGDKRTATWNRSSEPASVFELKSHVYNILSRLGVSIADLSIDSSASDHHFGAVETIALRSGEVVVRWGTVAEEQLQLHDIDVPVYYAEIEWDRIMKHVRRRTTEIHPIPKTLPVRRDFALLLDQRTPFAEIERVAYRAEQKLLKSVSLFDVYEDAKHLPEGKKSYAVAFELQDSDKTLSDKNIDKAMNRIFEALNRELGAVLR